MFTIYDTPGTTSLEETVKHATFLRSILTFKPFNVIFIQAKFSSRAIDFIVDLYKDTELIKKYSDNIVYLVSHIDQSEDPQAIIKETLEYMTNKKMNQQVLFYSNTKAKKFVLA